MEFLLLQRQEFDSVYNCSADFVPFTGPVQDGSSITGLVYIALGIFFSIPYLVCLAVFVKSNLMRQSCYKAMFFVGLVDVVELVLLGVVAGTADFLRVKFCDFPIPFYVLNCLNGALWYTHMTATLFLAASRCIYIDSDEISQFCFKGYRTWICVFFCSVLSGVSAFLVNSSPIFGSFIAARTRNPALGSSFAPFPQPPVIIRDANDALVTVGMPLLLLALVTIYNACEKDGIFSGPFLAMTGALPEVPDPDPVLPPVHNASRCVYLQITAMCSVNLINIALFKAVLFTSPSSAVHRTIHLITMTCYGSVPVMYLCINSNIRDRVWALIRKKD